jgi:DnaD/phage-associated family protein
LIQPVGYFKIWRELFSKPIWLNSTPEQKTILLTLLAMANFREKKWEWQGKPYECQPGQFITSLASIAKECGKGVAIKNVRTALDRFEKLEFLANQSAKTGRLITILNWELYQGDEEQGGKATGKDRAKTGQRPGKQVATKEEGKEVKKYTEEEEEKKRVGEIFKFFDNNINPITPFQSETIIQYLDEDNLEPQLITQILKDSIGKSIPWDWIKTVLQNCVSKGTKTLEQYEAKKAEKGRKKEEKGKGKPQNNKSTFNNFEGRGYDAKALEKWFLIRDRDDVTQEEKDKVYQELTNSSKGK